MDAYNKSRLKLGFPVEYELGHSIAEFTQTRNKQLMTRVKPLLVQLVCLDAHARRVGTMNGTFYLGGGQDPLVLTVAHVLGWGGAVRYQAAFDIEEAGESRPHTLELELCTSGTINPNLQATPPQAHEFVPDVAVFRCKVNRAVMPPLPPPLPPALPTIGDAAYIVAYTGDERTLSFSFGTVSSASLEQYTITAYADRSYSGAPVVNMRGFLMGIVVRGFETAIQQVSFVPASVIHTFLQTAHPQLPGLPAI